jgi:hypothetical protein
MKRKAVLAAALVGVVLSLGPGPTALAHPPIHERFGVEEFSFVIDEELCGFEVLVEIRQRFHLTLFVDEDGNVTGGHTTGQLFVWLTNLESGRTIRRVIPGPSFLDADGALVRGTGPWAFIFTVDGEVINAWGHITFDDSGLVISVRGRTEPFCGVLA